MKLHWFAIGLFCLPPVLFAQAGPQEPQQHQKRFGDCSCLPAYLAQYDVNGDGVINEEERQVMEQARDQIRQRLRTDWDADGDGQIGDQEREQARTQLRDMLIECRTARFNEADLDDDGQLSYDEFVLLPGMAKKVVDNPDLVAAIFDRLDADDSGTVSLEEFLACIKECDQARDGSCK